MFNINDFTVHCSRSIETGMLKATIEHTPISIEAPSLELLFNKLLRKVAQMISLPGSILNGSD